MMKVLGQVELLIQETLLLPNLTPSSQIQIKPRDTFVFSADAHQLPPVSLFPELHKSDRKPFC